MGRLRQRDLGDRIHQRMAEPVAFLPYWRIRAKRDRLAVKQGFQLRRKIERDKAQRDPGLLIIEPGQIHKLFLKRMHDIVVFLVTLRENDDAVSFFQSLYRIPESGDQPGVVVHGYGVCVTENQQRKGRDQMAQQLVKPAQRLGLSGPKVLICVGCHFPFLHHLRGAPDIMLPRHIELPCDRAVHMAVISHNDAWFVR